MKEMKNYFGGLAIPPTDLITYVSNGFTVMESCFDLTEHSKMRRDLQLGICSTPF